MSTQRFSVWAPLARTLEIDIEGKRYTMRRGERGWWSGEAQGDIATCYRFSVNGDAPTPDPRSRYQPEGVHGPSQLIKDCDFKWTDKHWQPSPLASAIVYELHVGTFTPEGTFLAAIEKLDYLADLGITYVELMPVNEFSGAWGWGYDGVGLYAPHHRYGSPNELKRFIDACHAKGLAVLLDVVYNHFGPAGNYLGRYARYLTDRHRTPWGEAVNLDGPGSHEVRKFFYDNALMWLRDYHVDGLRLDAVHAFVDSSAFHFLENLSSEVQDLCSQLGKYKVLIAESDLNDPRLIMPREANGYGLQAQWADDFHHALHAVLTGEQNGYYEDFGSFKHLAKALRTPYVYDGLYSGHRERHHGRPPIGLNGHHFVVCIQNHDQVGNRAQGERLSQLVNLGRQKIAAALLLTSAYVPLLFAGEEFGASTPFQYFTQHEDPELGQAVSHGRRGEFSAFGWRPEDVPDPQDPQTFSRSKLKWEEIEQPPHKEMLEWYRKLIALRRTAGLTDGLLHRVHVDFDEQARWFVTRRGHVEVAINLASKAQHVPIKSTGGDLLCSTPDEVKIERGSIYLQPDSAAVITPENLEAC